MIRTQSVGVLAEPQPCYATLDARLGPGVATQGYRAKSLKGLGFVSSTMPVINP